MTLLNLAKLPDEILIYTLEFNSEKEKHEFSKSSKRMKAVSEVGFLWQNSAQAKGKVDGTVSDKVYVRDYTKNFNRTFCQLFPHLKPHEGDVFIAKALIDSKITASVKLNEALGLAYLFKKSPEIKKWLFEAGAKVTANTLESALMSQASLETIKDLIVKGAPVSSRTFLIAKMFEAPKEVLEFLGELKR